MNTAIQQSNKPANTNLRKVVMIALLAALLGGGFSASVIAAEATSAPADAVVLAAEAININAASAEEIAKALKGVGMKKAQAIVQYREDFGDIKSLDDLKNVRGLGNFIIDRNASLIRF